MDERPGRQYHQVFSDNASGIRALLGARCLGHLDIRAAPTSLVGARRIGLHDWGDLGLRDLDAEDVQSATDNAYFERNSAISADLRTIRFHHAGERERICEQHRPPGALPIIAL